MEGKAEEQCKQWRGRDGRDGWLWIAAEGVGEVEDQCHAGKGHSCNSRGSGGLTSRRRGTLLGVTCSLFSLIMFNLMHLSLLVQEPLCTLVKAPC